MPYGLLLAFSGLWVVGCAPQDPREVVRTEAPESSTPSDSNGKVLEAVGSSVVFLGTSLTAGYGLEDPADRFTTLIQQRIQREGLPFVVVNAGVSGDTSAGGRERLGWILRNRVRVLVLELGANDGLRGLPVSALRDNLRFIVRTTRDNYPDAEVVVVGMEAPPNLGPDYTGPFREVFRDVATEFDASLIPFLLEGVAGTTGLNQADGIHPNREGQVVVAENVWTVLEPILTRIVDQDGAGER